MINIKIDSRKIEKGDTFVALKDGTVDGHDFINKTIIAIFLPILIILSLQTLFINH